MIGLVSVTAAGRAAADRLARAWPDARRYHGPAGAALPQAFKECDAIVCFLAVGATVRLLAPLLKGKHEDPGVVCVDEALRFAVPVLGAHPGGGNALARRVAETLGAEPVITTASDAAGSVGLDEFGADLGFRVEPGSDLAAVGAAILSGARVTFTADTEWPLPPLPSNVVRTDRPEPGVPAVVVTDLKIDMTERSAVYRPPSLLVGVGASRGASAAEIGQLIDGTLAELGLSPRAVRYIATADVKADEPGLLAAAAGRGWPVVTFPAGWRGGAGAQPERGRPARGGHAERRGGGGAHRAGVDATGRQAGQRARHGRGSPGPAAGSAGGDRDRSRRPGPDDAARGGRTSPRRRGRRPRCLSRAGR